MFKKVSTDMNFAAREREVLEFWEKNHIVERSYTLRDGGDKFTFYDGPPTSNGRPHIGHVETRAIKDLIPRYQTMKGRSVLRIAGWDTHGLPVELEVEKLLGINGKKQIEEYGIEPFIQKCKESVWKYLHEWEDMSKRVGFWVDMEHPYVTYHDTYIESEWWSLKKIWEKGLLYLGHKVVPYCPRCGTGLSSHEVAQGYKTLKERSAVVRFKVKGEDAYFLAWTTTPWTLPSNIALCVNPDEEYAKVKAIDGNTYYMASALLDTVLDPLKERHEATPEGKAYEVLETMPGKALEYREYEPLYECAAKEAETQGKKAFFVCCDGYVTMSDGTGIVHQAPAFGEDDARVGAKYDMPFVQMVDNEGRMKPETPFAGMRCKPTEKEMENGAISADPEVLKDLSARGLLFSAPKFEHDYPHCWRCDTPLLYYGRPTWYIRMTAVRDSLVRNNRSINWMPDNIKEGRMGNFVENVVDWGLSRERYWGTPLPVWQCEDGHIHVVGSKQELLDMAVGPVNLPELHRPYIDNVLIRCPHCGKQMRRVKDVIDCWYDSGSMPFAQWHYPFEHQAEFESRFPADFISEAIDQTRGWFYTLLAISTLLFDQSCFKNCLVMGHVQDAEGRKMSKHLGNVVDPWTVLDQQGADAVRWYFYQGAPWLPSRFSGEIVSDVQRKFMGTLWNTYAFFIMYAQLADFKPEEHPLENASLTLMDEWILSKLNTLIKEVDQDLAQYLVPEAARELTDFVDELSNWYVRRSRERFWGKGHEEDQDAAFATLYHVLVTLSKLLAPFTPFLAESMYQNLVRSVDENAPESVHFCDFPVSDERYIRPEMEAQMEALLKVKQLGASCRNLSSLKVRQPLSALYVVGAQLDETYQAVLKDELNVKSVIMTDKANDFVSYKLKPQMRTLGPRYGRLLGKIGAWLKETDGAAAVAAFERGENLRFTLDGTQIDLAQSDVLVETEQKAGLMAQSEGGITVVLDTNLTDELIAEGYARELVSKVQQWRKDLGFELTDRICLAVQTDETVMKALSAYKDMICATVLADSLTEGTADGAETREMDLNGKPANVSLRKAG